MDKLTKAAQHYLDLQSGAIHPTGKFDSARRFYPDVKFDCCKDIRKPSRRFPYSYMKHCRSMKHVANIYGVDKMELHKAVNVLKKGN